MCNAGLPPGWQDTSLGALGSFFRGRGGTKADEEPNGLPCIRYGDLYTHHDCIVRSFASSISPASTSSYTRLQQGDVVFAGSGETFEEIGKAAAYCEADPAYAGADTIIFRPSRELLANFAGYAVNSESANAHKSRMGQGSSVIHIGADHLSQMPFKLPPREQQQRIAEILSTVDEAIEQTEALIAKTQQIKAGLMHDLFTRGVTADGQLRPPREDAPQLYKESPLGWIPKEWEVSTLGENGEVLNGTTPSRGRPDYWGGDVPWLSSSRANDYIVREPTEYITRRALAECSVRLLPVGTVVVGMIGEGKTRGMSARLEIEATINQNLGAVVPGPNLDGVFCHLYLHHSYQRLRGGGRGSNQDALNCSLLAAFPVAAPPLSEQRGIAVRLQGVETGLDAEQQRARKLRLLKKGLMDDLLTGRVRVPLSDGQRVAASV